MIEPTEEMANFADSIERDTDAPQPYTGPSAEEKLRDLLGMERFGQAFVPMYITIPVVNALQANRSYFMESLDAYCAEQYDGAMKTLTEYKINVTAGPYALFHVGKAVRRVLDDTSVHITDVDRAALEEHYDQIKLAFEGSNLEAEFLGNDN